MRRFRSILSLLLAVVAVVVVGCGSSADAPPPTYTSEQISQIQRSLPTVTDLREKMPLLESKIQSEDWTDVKSFIHGPLGELRQKMSYVTRQMLPQDQKEASNLAKDLFESLEAIDVAADAGNYQAAIKNYGTAVKDFDDFLALVPEAAKSETAETA